MATNIDPKTGISYGITDAHNFPYLLDDICSNGDSLNYRAWKEELALKVADALESAIDDYCHNAGNVVGNLDCEELVKNLLDSGLSDSYECDEEEYEYEDSDGVQYLLSYLGGAPLIWICKSKYVTECRGCSPCIPNGGDLDTLGSGFLAYCPSPEDWNSREDAKYQITEELREDGLIELKIVELDS